MNQPTPDAPYVAIDPGETTGWAQFDDKGDCVAYGQFKLNEQVKYLDLLIRSGMKHVICEDYRNHEWVQQKKWSRNQTSKNIGKIELMCDLRNVPMSLQPNTVKSMGYMYMGLTPPSNHAISHQFDAMAHGVFWLQQNGVRPVGRSLMEKKDE